MFPVCCNIASLHIVDLPPLQSLPSELLMQNYPSLITSLVLDPQENDIVLDCCAAPGNKWSHLAMLMNDSGLLVLPVDRAHLVDWNGSKSKEGH